MASNPKAVADGVVAVRQHPQKGPQKKTPQKMQAEKVSKAGPQSQSSTTGSRSRQKKTTAAKGAAGSEVAVTKPAGPEDMQIVKSKKKKKKSAKGGEVAKKNTDSEWKLSPFVGGRYNDLDPVFSKDERHLFVANANLLKVFSTKTSLLVRTITVPSSAKYPEHIVGYGVDPRDAERMVIATPTRLFLWDWTSGEQLKKWQPATGPLQYSCIPTEEGTEGTGDIIIASKRPSGSAGSIVWSVKLDSDGTEVEKTQIFETSHLVTAVRVVDGGKAVCAIADKEILIANYDGGRWLAPRTFTMGQKLTCMDVYIQAGAKGKKAKVQRTGHVVVGDKTGALHILHDVVLRPATEPVAMKLHWHRKAVESVKWALNGSYVVSGGAETVLVIWQLETGIKQYLPHLGAAVRNIVVSPGGASYAISLSDNSTIIVSTTELKATANIAGIQSVSQSRKLQNALRVPCILHPTTANNLLLATPPNQLDRSGASPYLQTFDTHSDRHISRQALTRTNATNVNQAPDHTAIAEPNIVGLAATSDGEWLASVDEWHPPRRGPSATSAVDTSRGREVFLKFWKWHGKRKEWELVTRVDTPHPSQSDAAGSESILDITSTLSGQEFATIGADGCARIWRPKDRARAGTKTPGLTTWTCRKTIAFTKPRAIAPKSLLPASAAPKTRTWGAAAYSDDASLLAVASPEQGIGDDSLLHLLSPRDGTVLQTLGGMNLGRTHGLAILERYCILAGSRKLLVWNLVDGAVAWELVLSDIITSPITPGSVHLAADPHARTFALAFATADAGAVLVFRPDSPAPLCERDLDAPVAALHALPAGGGFVVLDVEARVQTLAPARLAVGAASAAAGAVGADEVESRLSALYLGATATTAVAKTEAAGDGDADGDVEMEDGSGSGDAVVPRQRLEAVFDQAPAFAAEAVFERVFELFAKRPLRAEEDDEDEDEE
ncbi:quinon protein alcohol dehydrogenase-like superfamily [Geopyxis carbonaria]|nr:quinon protein alcohol dehydrogenase-like superfamily [Geopyxis carbonaria]